MNRRSLLASCMGSMLLSSGPAFATSPDPIYLNVRTIVLFLRIVSNEKEYITKIPRSEMQDRLVQFMHTELVQGALQVRVFDRNTYQQPPDYPSAWVLWLECRVDLATAPADGASAKTVGVASVVLRRDEGEFVSREPFEVFVVQKDDGGLISAVEAAAREVLRRSVLNFVLRFNQ